MFYAVVKLGKRKAYRSLPPERPQKFALVAEGASNGFRPMPANELERTGLDKPEMQETSCRKYSP